ncbi:MAG: UvrABC system protein C [bacterium ADurb.Bin400]|nr:MAG: UvrABC system protein C [bacterium ADurb.Bin400]
MVSKLETEMRNASRNKEYEKAAVIRDRLNALDHIGEVAIGIKDDFTTPGKLAFKRIECYDISNISGVYAVGSMVVFVNGEPSKEDYRKFKIKNPGAAGDLEMMKEVLERRFRNKWPLPDLLVVDGGVTHLNLARKILEDCEIDIPVVSIAKGQERKKNEFHFSNHAIASYIRKNRELEVIAIKLRDEAHRFAKEYYKKLHSKDMLSD